MRRREYREAQAQARTRGPESGGSACFRCSPGLLSVLLAALLLTGGMTCARRRVKEPLIDGFLFKQVYPTYLVEHDRYFEVYDEDALPQIPDLRLNGQPVELTGFNPLHAVYEDANPFKVDTSYELTVKHYWGDARSKIQMPGTFRITWPDSSFVFNRDMPLLVNWQPSHGATWYWLNLYLTYDYNDQSGEWDFYEFDRDTIVNDTFCVYAANRFFPSQVRDILEGEGELVIWGCDGPKTEPGAMGNISGDGFGYYSSANQPREAYFVVVTPPATPLDRSEPMRRSRERLIRRIRQMTGVSDSLPIPDRSRPGRGK